MSAAKVPPSQAPHTQLHWPPPGHGPGRHLDTTGSGEEVVEEEGVTVDGQQCQQPRSTQQQQDSEGGPQARAGDRWAVSLAARPPMPVPVHHPGTPTPYSHRALLLKALPLGSTGGPGRQDVQEDTHLSGEEGV